MITAILGRAGSGKSYEATRWVLRELKKGRVVITTLPLNLKAEKWQSYLHSGQLEVHPYRGESGAYGAKAKDWETWREEKYQREIDGVLVGPLVVLDEVVFIWSEMGPKNDANENWIAVNKIIATHRHSAVDFLWISQTHLQMPTEIKKQIEEWIELSNLSKVGVKKGYSWSSWTTWYAPRDKLDGGVRFYSKDVYELYDTHALGAAAGSKGGERKKFFSERPIWTRLFFWFGIAAIGVMVWVVPRLYDLIVRYGSGDFTVGAPQMAPGAVAATTEEVPVVIEEEELETRARAKSWVVSGLPAETEVFERVTRTRVVWAGVSMEFSELSELGAFVIERRPCVLRMRVIGDGVRTWRCGGLPVDAGE